MTVQELAQLVKNCRDAQKRFFKGDRSAAAMSVAKDWERRVDEANDGQPQPRMGSKDHDHQTAHLPEVQQSLRLDWRASSHLWRMRHVEQPSSHQHPDREDSPRWADTTNQGDGVMGDGAHDNFLDRKETPKHPVDWKGYYVGQEHYDSMVAELTRLRSLLANAYTAKPLQWSIKGEGEQAVANSATDDFMFFVHCTNGQWRWDWDWMHGPAAAVEATCTDLADGQRKAEAWHHARVTEHLTKFEQAKS